MPDNLRGAMFSIRQLFSIVTIFAMLVLILGLYLARFFWFYPIEMELYLKHRQNEMNSLTSLIDQHEQKLLANVIDYSSHHDIHLLAQAREKNKKLPLPKMDILQLDVVFFVDKNKDLVFAKEIADASNKLPIDPSLATWYSQLDQDSAWFSAKPQSDIIQMHNREYFAASAPVFDPDNGHLLGWLGFLQEFTPELLNSFGSILQMELQPISLPTENEFIPSLTLPIVNGNTKHDRCIYNIKQMPTYCFSVEHKDELYSPVLFDFGLFMTYLLVIMVPVFMFSAFLNTLAKPLIAASNMLDRHSKSGDPLPFPVDVKVHVKEINVLRLSYNGLIETIRKQHKKLESLSLTDRLTEISNRRAFDYMLDITWRRMTRRSESIALIIIDIDYFKLYNDQYGHLIGDRALISVALALKSCARRADEMTARIGGEEFALILHIDDVAHMNWVRERLEDVVTSLQIPHSQSDISDYMTISIGISWIQKSGFWIEKFSPEHWLQDADSALYQAKNTGRNRSVLHVITADAPLKDLHEEHE